MSRSSVVVALVVVALVALLGACAPREVVPAVAAPVAALRPPPLPPPPRREPGARAAPGLRLPDGVAPLAYDLRLELDPERDAFRGRVEIRTRLERRTDAVWVHAVDLAIVSATYREGGRAGGLTALAPGDQMLGFALEAPAGPGEIVLVFEFTGHASRDQEGLFRRQIDGRGYLWSQSQATFARRILPCFDEPRFKVPWKLTLVVPAGMVALGNAPVATERVRADGRREVAFAEIGPLPSYLLAIAVGPFAVVEGGAVGRANRPLRVVTWPSEASRAAVAVRVMPAIVDAFERYLGQPLPWPKLDLVTVPEFFGAMENVGLVTFETSILLGDAKDAAFRRRLIRIAAHEIAHQWFGNALTPAWWDELWLSEAFASFLGEKLAAELAGFDDVALGLHQAREAAFAADVEPGTQALRRAIVTTAGIEPMFDAIAYEKGGAVLAMFEHYLGADRMREVLRTFVRRHALGSVTTADLIAVVAHVTTPAIAFALASYADHDGTPIVELALRCDGAPALIASARGGVTVPVCARAGTGTGASRRCALVGARTEIPLGTSTCPTWVIGNDGGHGYYQLAWRAPAPLPPIARATPGERLAIGSDVAGGVERGEVVLAEAARVIRILAASRDPHAQLAAVAIARVIDPLVDDAARPRWAAWFARELRRGLGVRAMLSPRTAVARALRDELAALVPAELLDPATIQAARGFVDRQLATEAAPTPTLVLALGIVAPRGGGALFDKLLAVARSTSSAELAATLLEALGRFGPALAPRLVDTLITGTHARPPLRLALIAMLERPATRTAAWRALRDRSSEVLRAGSSEDARTLLTATGALCDPTSRAEVMTAFAPRIVEVAAGPQTLEDALAAIDHCLARRASLGEILGQLPR